MPVGDIAEFAKLLPEILAIARKRGIEKSADVLDHDSLGSDLVNDAQGVGEEIAFVSVSKLLSCNGKWRTGKPTGKQVDTTDLATVKMLKVGLFTVNHVPGRAVELQRIPAVPVDFDQSLMAVARALDTESLTPCPGTKLNRS